MPLKKQFRNKIRLYAMNNEHPQGSIIVHIPHTGTIEESLTKKQRISRLCLDIILYAECQAESCK